MSLRKSLLSAAAMGIGAAVLLIMAVLYCFSEIQVPGYEMCIRDSGYRKRQGRGYFLLHACRAHKDGSAFYDDVERRPACGLEH